MIDLKKTFPVFLGNKMAKNVEKMVVVSAVRCERNRYVPSWCTGYNLTGPVARESNLTQMHPYSISRVELMSLHHGGEHPEVVAFNG